MVAGNMEARLGAASTTLEYDKLPGIIGDEKWRATAVESKVRLQEDGSGQLTCSVSLQSPARATNEAWAPCGAEELPMQPAPEGLLMKFLVFFPYPVIEGLGELPCLD